MSAEIFERNVGEMVRRSALRPDESRSRERFLAAARPSGSRSGRMAALAAAVLVGITIYWAAAGDRRPDRPGPTDSAPAPVTHPPPFPARGGNEFLNGAVRTIAAGPRSSRMRFDARSPLPAGLIFRVRVHRLQEAFQDGRISPGSSVLSMENPELVRGGFGHEWNLEQAAELTIEISAPDGLQDMAVLKRVTLPEAERAWTFTFSAWDERLLGRLGPQLAELDSFEREARDLVRRCAKYCESEPVFREHQKELITEALRLQARVEHFGLQGLYPAACSQIGWTVRDLATSMPIFKWEGSKFAGPVSYYTNSKRGPTFRGETFEFDALLRYLDEAKEVAGREFCLWILRDVARAGIQDAQRALVREQAAHAGVAGFSNRLFEPGTALEAELRRVAK